MQPILMEYIRLWIRIRLAGAVKVVDKRVAHTDYANYATRNRLL